MYSNLSSVWSNESRIRTFAIIKILEEIERISPRRPGKNVFMRLWGYIRGD